MPPRAAVTDRHLPMKTIAILSCSTALATLAPAAVVERWSARLDASYYDHAVGPKLDAEGNAYFAVNKADNDGFGGGQGEPRGWVVTKYSATGSILWTTSSPDSSSILLRDLSVDSHGHCRLTGSAFLASGERTYAARIDANGTLAWEYLHTPPADHSHSSGSAILADATGGTWIAGAVVTNDAGFIYPVAGQLIRLDAGGQPMMETVHTLPDVTFSAGFSTMTMDASGALLFRQPGYPAHAGWRAYVVKFSAAGDPLWHRATDIIDLTWLGNYPLAGPLTDADGNVFLAGSILESDFHIKLLKLDSSGTPVWHARYSPRYGFGADVSGMAIGPDGGVTLTGNSDTAYNPDDFYVRDIVTLRFSGNGTFRWLARGTDPVHATFGRQVVTDRRANAYVAGESSSVQTMKFNQLGQRVWSVAHPTAGLVTSVALSPQGTVVVGGSEGRFFDGPTDGILTVYREISETRTPRFLRAVCVSMDRTTVSLEAKAIGPGLLRYRWYRDGLPIVPPSADAPSPTQPYVPQNSGNTRRLTLPNSPQSAAEYWVEVSNRFGTIVSEAVRVGLPSLDARPGDGIE